MKKIFKDRQDGWYLKPPTPLHALMPHLMRNRTEAEVSTREVFDVTEIMKYIEKKNKNSDYKYTFFHAFLTAMAKTIYNRPYLNRFISGRRMYERKFISFGFVAKQKFEDHSEENLMIMKLDNKMNIDDISKKVSGDVKKVRSNKGNSMADDMAFFGKMPRWMLRIVFFVLRFLDFHGWVPKSIWQSDSNYVTILFSNLGSIKCPSCYHHLNNYGTNSIMITIGEIRKEKRLNDKGVLEDRDMVDITFTLDERIADGFYFAKSVRILEKILKEPKLFDDNIDKELHYEK